MIVSHGIDSSMVHRRPVASGRLGSKPVTHAEVGGLDRLADSPW